MSGLDFLVIGAQKAGTTTLWQLLREHPQLDLAAAKEAPFFADDRLWELGMERYEASFFGPRRPGVLRGSVSPQYMFDSATLGVSDIAARIARARPDVKLVAILRDPIERAISHHRMTVRRGYERRRVDQALAEQLSPGALDAARRPVAAVTPADAVARVYANSRYLAAGEYGRILTAYRRHFDPSQLLTVLTSDLQAQPGVLVERILRFLGVDASWQPADLQVRRLVGGDRTRVSPEDLQALAPVLAAALPLAPIGAFEVALQEWNTLAGPPAGGLPTELERRLRRHFAADARGLQADWGVGVPWIADEPAAEPAQLTPSPRPDGPARSPRPSAGPVTRSDERPAGIDRIAGEIAAAVESRTGYALIRLEAREALLLDERTWPGSPQLAEIGVRQSAAVAAESLRRAIAEADAVCVPPDGRTPAGELDQILRDLELQPRLTCRPTVAHELLGVEPSTGRQLSSPPLKRILAGLRLAAVCPAAAIDWVTFQAQERALRRAEDQVRPDELDVRVAVGLDDLSEIDRVLVALGAQREAYDAVVVHGDLAARPACVRIARELEVVALDLGFPLARFLHPGYNQRSARLARARWEVQEYLRGLRSPERPSHPLDGRLVAAPTGPTFYIERGRRRLIEHPALLALFDHEPTVVPADVLDALISGPPVAVVHERLTGPFVLLDGRRRAVQLGVTLLELDDLALAEIPEAGPTLSWPPQA